MPFVDMPRPLTATARAYVTYFDQRYLAFGLVMLRSLRRADPGAVVYVLCHDALSFVITTRLGDPQVFSISADEVLAFEPRLAACESRGRMSFYATHKPVLPLLVLSRRPDLHAVIHIDADVFFFSSVAPLFDEIGAASIALSPHRFSRVFQSLDVHGAFNAGFIYWRNDELGRRCLTEYRDDCLAWCEPDILPDGRFMNQGYLTRWPERYGGVHVVQHPGVNLAYWNVADRHITRWPLRVDGQPVIFYHFSGVNRDPLGVWRSPRREFGSNLDAAVRGIYDPFLRRVERTDRRLHRKHPGLGPLATGWEAGGKPVRRGPWPRTLDGWKERARLKSELNT